jgi:pimeloyl-ACP methyl ester carboxylesterase
MGRLHAMAVRGFHPLAAQPSRWVVCIHGFGGFRWQLAPLASFLKRCGFLVYNYTYAARKYTLEEHGLHFAEFLTSLASKSLDSSPFAERAPSISFVTHSFGGVLLRETLTGAAWHTAHVTPNAARVGRAVCIGPPFAGASLARALRHRDAQGRMPYRFLEQLARRVLGPAAGAQLLDMPSAWFLQRGGMPETMPVLVIAGDVGRVNPLITRPSRRKGPKPDSGSGLATPDHVFETAPSDGIVGVHETWLPSRHWRLRVRLPHNMLLYAPVVREATAQFLLAQGDDAMFGLTLASAMPMVGAKLGQSGDLDEP